MATATRVGSSPYKTKPQDKGNREPLPVPEPLRVSQTLLHVPEDLLHRATQLLSKMDNKGLFMALLTPLSLEGVVLMAIHKGIEALEQEFGEDGTIPLPMGRTDRQRAVDFISRWETIRGDKSDVANNTRAELIKELWGLPKGAREIIQDSLLSDFLELSGNTPPWARSLVRARPYQDHLTDYSPVIRGDRAVDVPDSQARKEFERQLMGDPSVTEDIERRVQDIVEEMRGVTGERQDGEDAQKVRSGGDDETEVGEASVDADAGAEAEQASPEDGAGDRENEGDGGPVDKGR